MFENNFENYLDLKDFTKVGESNVVDVSITMTEHGSFNTNRVFYSLERDNKCVKDIGVYYFSPKRIICFVAETREKEDPMEFTDPHDLIKILGTLVRPLIEEMLPRLEKRQKYTIPGKAYISEGKVFFSLDDAVVTEPKKGKKGK